MGIEATEVEYRTAKMMGCSTQPAINVLSQKDFQKRASVIFQTLDDVLGRSLGAYGAPTIISTYPYSHITKDGFTIARNIEFAFHNGDEVDRAIAKLATEICTRLNYAVGDGTTSAIVAVNQIYKSAMNILVKERKGRPRDVLKVFKEVKDEIIDLLEKESGMIREDNLADIIRKIVYVSSNGDKRLTDMIVQAYQEIGAPSISSDVSDTSEMYLEIINGYKSDIRIADKIYYNNDKQTADHRKVDVIMFDHKITSETYKKIIEPLAKLVRYLGRHLLCIAPWYDETLLQSTISRNLNAEYKQTGDISLIIASYPRTTETQKKNFSDLAILLNTSIIDKGLEYEILDYIGDEIPEAKLMSVINISDRDIPGINVFDPAGKTMIKSDDYMALKSSSDEFENKTKLLDLGFADEMSGSMKSTTFKVSHYNKDLYEKILEEARITLQDTIDKFSSLGTYTKDVVEAQTRYSALRLKTAIIYVGADSELSRGMLRDSVDDAIRAAESAYRFGYIQGCNLTLGKVISKMYDVERDETRKAVLYVLQEGFKNVYKRVLGNAFTNPYCDAEYKAILTKFNEEGINLGTEELSFINNIGYKMKGIQNDVGQVNIIDIIIEISYETNKVLDLETMRFSRDIINSTKTDVEILTATIDLLGILMTGNQVVISGWNRTA